MAKRTREIPPEKIVRDIREIDSFDRLIIRADEIGVMVRNRSIRSTEGITDALVARRDGLLHEAKIRSSIAIERTQGLLGHVDKYG